MSSTKSHISTTLPRNFTFHYADGEPPRTPEHESTLDLTQPPEPPRQTFRVKRRRPALRSEVPNVASDGDQIPSQSVQLTESLSREEPVNLGFTEHPLLNHLTAGYPPHVISAQPKTPESQVLSAAINLKVGLEWEMSDQKGAGESIRRPASACSAFSDSSVSSRGSFGSFPSFGGSCTSPESEAQDPFVNPTFDEKTTLPTSPLQARGFAGYKRRRLYHPKWTAEMDHHLWVTFMRYLQDPTVTPFKMLPGITPPLGVCSRVARQAKRTWKGSRNLLSPQVRQLLRNNAAIRAGSPDTIKPVGSGNTTPTNNDSPKLIVPWPRSESATRRRLRELCKRRPSLSAHYQRLVHAKSASPQSSSTLPSSAVGMLSSPFTESRHQQTFSTRDMNFSLATSTAASMQEGNPLAQLAENVPSSQSLTEDKALEPAARTHAHQKSHSLQLGLGLDGKGTDSHQGLLASPFKEFPPSSERMTEYHSPYMPATVTGAMVPTLAPPAELRESKSMSRSFKRRAQHQLEDELSPGGSDRRRNLLQEMFSSPSENRHRRVRSRGFSLGDVGSGAQRLSALFTPPADEDEAASATSASAIAGAQQLLQPRLEAVQRLGSPFTEHSSSSNHNTFPRAFSAHNFEAVGSIEERLGETGSNTIPRRH